MKKERQLSKELRMLGYSQKEAADILGTTREVVSNWATGKSRISPVYVQKLKDMGVPIKAIREPSKEV